MKQEVLQRVITSIEAIKSIEKREKCSLIKEQTCLARSNFGFFTIWKSTSQNVLFADEKRPRLSFGSTVMMSSKTWSPNWMNLNRYFLDYSGQIFMPNFLFLKQPLSDSLGYWHLNSKPFLMRRIVTDIFRGSQWKIFENYFKVSLKNKGSFH